MSGRSLIMRDRSRAVAPMPNAATCPDCAPRTSPESRRPRFQSQPSEPVPRGSSTMRPGRPLMIAKRIVKSSRHHVSARLRVASTMCRTARSAPSMTFSADRTLPPPSVTMRTSLARSCCHRIEITRLSCRHECGQELRMFRIDLARTRRRDGGVAWPDVAHVRAGAGGELPARRLAPLQCRGHFFEREVEHVVQQKGRPLEWRQPVERQEQCDRTDPRPAPCALSGASAAVSTTGSGSHGPHVLLAPCSRRFQRVETNARGRGHEKRSRIRHVVAVGLMPAQIGLLHRVLGVSHGPKHAVGEADQASAVRFKALGWVRHRVRGVHACPPLDSPAQALRP